MLVEWLHINFNLDSLALLTSWNSFFFLMCQLFLIPHRWQALEGVRRKAETDGYIIMMGNCGLYSTKEKELHQYDMFENSQALHLALVFVFLFFFWNGTRPSGLRKASNHLILNVLFFLSLHLPNDSSAHTFHLLSSRGKYL
ncbi:hypothetical protein ACJX0J_026072 [Zea mays]